MDQYDVDNVSEGDFDVFSSIAGDEAGQSPARRSGKKFSLENLYHYFSNFIGIFILSMVIFSRPFGRWLFGDILKTVAETSLSAEIIKSAILTVSFSLWKMFSES